MDAQRRSVVRAIPAFTRATAAEHGGPDDDVVGANTAGFLRVADAMIDQRLV